MNWRLAVLALAAFVGGSCGSAPRQESAPRTLSPAPLDLQSVVRRAHFAYQLTPQGFQGGHDTYAVDVDRAGRVSLTTRGKGLARLSLETSLVRCADRALTSASVARSNDGHLELRHGSVVEHLENRESGLEQSWTFVEAPCNGTLEIVVRTGDMKPTTANTSGLHFRDEAAGAGFVYGHGRFVDARGRETEIPARLRGQEIVLVVPAEVVARTTWPATLDPVIGPELATDEPVRVPATDTNGDPQIAFADKLHLVVWTDRSTYRSGVRAARVTEEGVVLDPFGLSISAGSGRERPIVVSDGSQFLVSWLQANGSDKDVYAVRVNEGGGVLDPSPLPLVTGAKVTDHAFAFDGTSYVMAWADGDVHARRFSTTGTALGLTTDICTLSSEQYGVSLASNAGRTLVTWSNSTPYTDLYGARLGADGSLLDSTPITIAADPMVNEGPARIATDGTDFLLAWMENGSSGPRVATRRLSGSGTWLDSASTLVADAWNAGLSLRWDGTQYWLLLQDGAGISPLYLRLTARRFTKSGVMVDAGEPLVLSTAASGSTAGDLSVGKKSLMAVESSRRTGTSNSLWATRITKSGSLVDAPAGVDHISLYSHANGQAVGAVAYGAGEYMLVFGDGRLPGLFGVRVGANGIPVDSVALPISTNGLDAPPSSLVFDGANFVMAWHRAATSSSKPILRGARISPSGTLLDGTNDDPGVVLTTMPTLLGSALSAASPSERFVFFRQWSPVTSAYAQRLGADLTPVGSPIALSSKDVGALVAVWNGSNHAYAFNQLEGTDWSVHVGRLSGTGALLDGPSGLAIDTSSGTKGALSLATNGAVSLLAYQSAAGLLTWSLTSTGSASPLGGPLSVEASSTAVTWDGVGWVVASYAYPDTFARFLTAAGSPISGPLKLGGIGTIGGLASSGDQRSLFVWSDDMALTTLGASRVGVRLLDRRNANGAACSLATQCASGFCVDGVCCDSACGGGLTSDCQACTIGRGAKVDGTCAIREAGAVCRPAAGTCDLAELCGGTSVDCPGDVGKAEGASCDDGNTCTVGDICSAGSCIAGSARLCPASECRVSLGCVPTSGCVDDKAPDGTLCDAGTCVAGACVAKPDAGPEIGSDAATDAADSSLDADAAEDAAPDTDAREESTEDTLRPDTSSDAPTLPDTSSDPAETGHASSDAARCSCTLPARRTGALGGIVGALIVAGSLRRRWRASAATR